MGLAPQQVGNYSPGTLSNHINRVRKVEIKNESDPIYGNLDGIEQITHYIEINGKYYVQSSQGNIEINGQRYFEINSSETVTLYLFENKLYNKNEAGNIIWGAALYRIGVPKVVAYGGAHTYSLYENRALDEPWDVDAWSAGWDYEHNLEKKVRKKKQLKRLRKIK